MQVDFCSLVEAGDGKIVISGTDCHVIVIQNTENWGYTGFFELSCDGILLGFINLLIYWV